MCLSLTFWGTENNQFLIFAMAIVIHGIWSLLASIKPARHLVIAMLEGKSQGFHKYEHTHSYEKIREIQNETRKIAIGFIVLGMVMIFINII